ncbi:hypothetical protein K469DRAFT_307841 [Zopfia rhizophila CBS 207.26]|uniref:Uncharacterized protein n=1 Tax=Zopfia rhizophila CBS 207.26 TaxID=1314779 RepID=A0A6A6EQQ2_9PEZI|nr:hypothetical protein K469DRAFT_307841 [Zopfia rhizophila CBS 207.26]
MQLPTTATCFQASSQPTLQALLCLIFPMPGSQGARCLSSWRRSPWHSQYLPVLVHLSCLSMRSLQHWATAGRSLGYPFLTNSSKRSVRSAKRNCPPGQSDWRLL